MSSRSCDEKSRKKPRRLWNALGPFPRSVWIHPCTPEDSLDRACARVLKRSILASKGVWPHLPVNAYVFAEDIQSYEGLVNGSQSTGHQKLDKVMLMTQYNMTQTLLQGHDVTSPCFPDDRCRHGHEPGKTIEIISQEETDREKTEEFLEEILPKQATQKADIPEGPSDEDFPPLPPPASPRVDRSPQQATISKSGSYKATLLKGKPNIQLHGGKSQRPQKRNKKEHPKVLAKTTPKIEAQTAQGVIDQHSSSQSACRKNVVLEGRSSLPRSSHLPVFADQVADEQMVLKDHTFKDIPEGPSDEDFPPLPPPASPRVDRSPQQAAISKSGSYKTTLLKGKPNIQLHGGKSQRVQKRNKKEHPKVLAKATPKIEAQTTQDVIDQRSSSQSACRKNVVLEGRSSLPRSSHLPVFADQVADKQMVLKDHTFKDIPEGPSDEDFPPLPPPASPRVDRSPQQAAISKSGSYKATLLKGKPNIQLHGGKPQRVQKRNKKGHPKVLAKATPKIEAQTAQGVIDQDQIADEQMVLKDHTFKGGDVELGRSADGAHMAQSRAGSGTGTVQNAAGPPDNAKCHIYHEDVTVAKTKATGPGSDTSVPEDMDRIQIWNSSGRCPLQNAQFFTGMGHGLWSLPANCFLWFHAPEVDPMHMVVNPLFSSNFLPPPGFDLDPYYIAGDFSLWSYQHGNHVNFPDNVNPSAAGRQSFTCPVNVPPGFTSADAFTFF